MISIDYWPSFTILTDGRLISSQHLSRLYLTDNCWRLEKFYEAAKKEAEKINVLCYLCIADLRIDFNDPFENPIAFFPCFFLPTNDLKYESYMNRSNWIIKSYWNALRNSFRNRCSSPQIFVKTYYAFIIKTVACI